MPRAFRRLPQSFLCRTSKKIVSNVAVGCPEKQCGISGDSSLAQWKTADSAHFTGRGRWDVHGRSFLNPGCHCAAMQEPTRTPVMVDKPCCGRHRVIEFLEQCRDKHTRGARREPDAVDGGFFRFKRLIESSDGALGFLPRREKRDFAFGGEGSGKNTFRVGFGVDALQQPLMGRHENTGIGLCSSVTSCRTAALQPQ